MGTCLQLDVRTPPAGMCIPRFVFLEASELAEMHLLLTQDGLDRDCPTWTFSNLLSLVCHPLTSGS